MFSFIFILSLIDNYNSIRKPSTNIYHKFYSFKVYYWGPSYCYLGNLCVIFPSYVCNI